MARGLVCMKDSKFLRIKKNNVCIEEGMPNGDGSWSSYKLWFSDLYECPECGFELATGFGQGPVAEHYQAGYSEARERLQPLTRVDDCGGAKP